MNKDTFYMFLKNGTYLDTYKVGKKMGIPDKNVFFEQTNNMGFTFYSLDDFFSLSVYEDGVIFSLGINLWDKNFKKYIYDSYHIKKLAFRNVLIILKEINLNWEIEKNFTYHQQICIKLDSGVMFYFGVDAKSDLILYEVMISNSRS